MAYKERIEELSKQIPTDIVDFNALRKRNRPPTQASSEFITNREQGDWAERLVRAAINKTSKKYVAVQYGRSDKLVAGEAGFVEFYETYQDELDTIGKRPDLLIFNVQDYNYDWGFDISTLSRDVLNEIVPMAVAGLEIRSSAFLIEKYDAELRNKILPIRAQIASLKQEILADYPAILDDEIVSFLSGSDEDDLADATYRLPARRSSRFDAVLTTKFKEINKLRSALANTRDFLSLTPKVEDIYVVHKWIQTYGVPHYYFQVFFDKVYGIPFEQVVSLISNNDNRNRRFFIEQDVKNQFKSTIKINVKEGREIAYRVTMPGHRSEMKELPRGRLLFHVTFEGGEAYLNLETLYNLLLLTESE